MSSCSFFFQAEDGIRDLVRSRGLVDVYKRQSVLCAAMALEMNMVALLKNAMAIYTKATQMSI